MSWAWKLILFLQCRFLWCSAPLDEKWGAQTPFPPISPPLLTIAYLTRSTACSIASSSVRTLVSLWIFMINWTRQTLPLNAKGQGQPDYSCTCMVASKQQIGNLTRNWELRCLTNSRVYDVRLQYLMQHLLSLCAKRSRHVRVIKQNGI